MDKPHKTHSKTIKTLKNNAAKGNLLSMFQLYENYKSGKNVEAVDDELAQTYFDMILDHLPSSVFSIKSINLHEFRRFRDLTIKFDKQMTVIIGDNGAGKTSIAESLSKLLSWFNQNLIKSNVNAKKIVESDINIFAKDYSELIGQFHLGNKTPLNLSLATPVTGYSGNKSGDVAKSKQMGDMYRSVADKKNIELPILAFYSVERASFTLPKSPSDKTFLDVANSRFNALKDSLDASSQLEEFSRRYIELFNLAEGEETQEIKESRMTINSLNNLIEKLHKGTEPPAESELVIELNAENDKLNKLLDNKSRIHSKQLERVNYAIETLVPDVRDLRADRSKGNQRLLVENFGNVVNISQLSQGQKSLVALTGDLALRLVTLNPNLENSLSGHGIVIIDEIELHLHPKWQQQIMLGLQETFPNIQFIVTTHSPQVLSTVDKNCIRQISFDDNSELTVSTPVFQTKGVTSADILARIMETNSTPENIKEAAWLSDFSRYLQSGDTASLEDVFIKIKNHYGSVHPVVVECESQVRIFEMKSRLKRD